MADQTIRLRWTGRGSIVSDNITPVTLKHIKGHSVGEIDNPSRANLIIEGDNVPVMKSLAKGAFRLRGKVDFLLWDPPYNTGNKGASGFIYEDNFYLTREEQKRWAETNRKMLLEVGIADDGASLVTQAAQREPLWVKETDQSRHSKWLSFMEVRLELAKKLLKDTGTIAVHIGYQELFRLGLLMDEVFGEENRLGIINWECAYSPKNDKKGSVPSSTDYVLIYAKDKSQVYRGTLARTEEMNARYKNPDGDSDRWKSKDLSASSGTADYNFGIENPITGQMYFPPSGAFWRNPRHGVLAELNKWGVAYEIDAEGNVVVKVGEDRSKAQAVQEDGPWPRIYFGMKGTAGPAAKHYLSSVQDKSRVIGTYWEAEDVLDSDTDEDDGILDLSLSHELSDHNDAAKKLIKAVLGGACVFDTPKPLKLTERLIQMFCPQNGTVLDAFAGSGTTAHAVLRLNSEGASRRFILIERGSTGDGYAETITAERVRRVITGKWAKPKKDTIATGGSFAYFRAGGPISKQHILESKRDDLVDIILTSHEGSLELDTEAPTSYLIGRTAKGNAIALVWGVTKGSDHNELTMDIYKSIMAEAKKYGMPPSKDTPVFIYGAINGGPNGSPNYTFHQIPNEILAALGITNLTD